MATSSDHIEAPLQAQEAFGKAVRLRLHELELSQEELGARFGLDRTYVSVIEGGGSNPTIQTIWTLSEGLSVAPSELLSRTERRLKSSQEGSRESPPGLPEGLTTEAREEKQNH